MKPNFKKFVFLHSSKYYFFRTATFLVRAPRINLRTSKDNHPVVHGKPKDQEPRNEAGFQRNTQLGQKQQ